MDLFQFLFEFRAREKENDIRKATWYIIAAVSLTAACAGEHVGELYTRVTAGLDLKDRIIVQRRMKEAILKGSILFGVPRAAQGFGPLFRAIPDSEIDTFSPRTDKMTWDKDNQRREERGRKYFDQLWGCSEAQAHRNRTTKYYPDHYLLNIKTNYELWMSENAVLSDIETQMCNTALLICNNSPEQALWHLRGLVRHGGTLDQARFAQDMGVAIAKQFDARTGSIMMVDEVDPQEWELPL